MADPLGRKDTLDHFEVRPEEMQRLAREAQEAEERLQSDGRLRDVAGEVAKERAEEERERLALRRKEPRPAGRGGSEKAPSDGTKLPGDSEKPPGDRGNVAGDRRKAQGDWGKGQGDWGKAPGDGGKLPGNDDLAPGSSGKAPASSNGVRLDSGDLPTVPDAAPGSVRKEKGDISRDVSAAPPVASSRAARPAKRGMSIFFKGALLVVVASPLAVLAIVKGRTPDPQPPAPAALATSQIPLVVVLTNDPHATQVPVSSSASPAVTMAPPLRTTGSAIVKASAAPPASSGPRKPPPAASSGDIF